MMTHEVWTMNVKRIKFNPSSPVIFLHAVQRDHRISCHLITWLLKYRGSRIQGRRRINHECWEQPSSAITWPLECCWYIFWKAWLLSSSGTFVAYRDWWMPEEDLAIHTPKCSSPIVPNIFNCWVTVSAFLLKLLAYCNPPNIPKAGYWGLFTPKPETLPTNIFKVYLQSGPS